MEQLTHIDGSTAASKHDNKEVFSILDNAIIDPQARSWLINSDGQATDNGRQGWFKIEALCEEENNDKRCIRELQIRLCHQKYTGMSVNNAFSLTLRLFGIYESLE